MRKKEKQYIIITVILIIITILLGLKIYFESHNSAHIFMSFMAAAVVIICSAKSILSSPIISKNKNDRLMYFDISTLPFHCYTLTIYTTTHNEYPSYIYKNADGVLQLRYHQHSYPLSSFSFIDYAEDMHEDKKYFILHLQPEKISTKFMEKILWFCFAAVIGIFVFSMHFATNDKYKNRIDNFVKDCIEIKSDSDTTESSESFCYNPDSATDAEGRQQDTFFKQCHFLLAMNDSEQNGIGFAKILCINPNNYNVDVINLNPHLICGDTTLKAVLDSHRDDCTELMQSIQDIFKIKIDDVFVLNDDVMSDLFSKDCIEWTLNPERKENTKIQQAFTDLQIPMPEDTAYYSYGNAISLLQKLEYYTDDAVMNHAGHAAAMESIICDLQNDLLYSVLKNIAMENYDTNTANGKLGISTTMNKEEISALTYELRNRIASFISSFRSESNSAMFPYSSECMCFRDEHNQVMVYTSDGFIESQVVHELYYRIVR